MAAMMATLVLNDDVVIAPVSDLDLEVVSRIDHADGDFAVSRLHGRGGSSIIDADAAKLLDRFREPRTVVDAVILYARERDLEPGAVLEEAYPLLRGMVERRVLVATGESSSPATSAAPWAAGTRLPMGSVIRVLQILEDTEVYLIGDAGEPATVVKIQRASATPAVAGSLRVRMRHEADFLRHLGGDIAPRLLGHGEIEGRAYLHLEFVAGTDAEQAAAELRGAADGGRAGLLDLARAIAGVYAELHARDVLHGDVHPRNVLVDRNGRVRLIDFGLARSAGTTSDIPGDAPRGGVPFYFDPELAAAFLERRVPPPVSPASEQFAVGALLYALLTGGHWQNFRLGRTEMLRDILEWPVLPFVERRTEPWPAMEAVLQRALAKASDSRFPSMAEFSDAVMQLAAPPFEPSPAVPVRRARFDALLDAARIGGPWMAAIPVAPTVSVTYGAAGVALGLLQIATRRGASDLLATADAWVACAARGMVRDDAFYNAAIQITPDTVGETSPYHAPSGVHAAAALVARAIGDPFSQSTAVMRFIEASRRPTNGLDLTTGRSSVLLGAAIMLDALPPGADDGALRMLGNSTLDELWRSLDALGPVSSGAVEYLGIAHGWAGFLYATLQWCRLSGTPVPAGVERRCAELATIAMPVARGLEWPWVLRVQGDPPTMPGWCNGSAGYVLLWTAAHRVLGQRAYEDLAAGAAWSAWESPEPAETLCCGLAGRAYALLALYRHTGDPRWLSRARSLAARANEVEPAHREYEHSLYKGALGLAVLEADLEVPDESAMPFFEPAGYRGA